MLGYIGGDEVMVVQMNINQILSTTCLVAAYFNLALLDGRFKRQR